MVGWSEMRQLLPLEELSTGGSLEYAQKHRDRENPAANAVSRKREQERFLEDMTPYLKELIKKLLKEERDYYKSRPSLAAKYYGEVLPRQNREEQNFNKVSVQVYHEIETRMRREWMRKGGY